MLSIQTLPAKKHTITLEGIIFQIPKGEEVKIHNSLLGFWLAGKVVLVAIVMEMFGWLFLIVWCGVFGRREIVVVLKTRSVPCLISSFFFLEPYLIGSLCGETILFFLFWIFLIFVMFVFDLFSLVYSWYTWVSLSFWYQWIFITYPKKKNPQFSHNKTMKQ